MATKALTIASYLAGLEPVPRRYLARVLALIGRAVPAAAPEISYRIPAFRLPEGVFLYAAAWKAHYALYPATPEVLRAFATELAAFEVRKDTIRIGYDQRMPAHLIGAIARMRAEETRAAAAKSKRAPATSKRAAAKSKRVAAKR